MPSLFFPPAGPEIPQTEEEAEWYSSPEATGARLVEFISGICESAWQQLSDELKEKVGGLSLKKPDWLDSTVPDMALNELHRIAYQLPRYMPDKRMVLTESETFSFMILVQTRDVIEVAGKIKNPENALLLIEASIGLGLKLAEATVAPFEPHAAKQIRTFETFTKARHAKNSERAEKAAERNRQWQGIADEKWSRNPSLTISDVATQIASSPEGVKHNWKVGTIRNNIKKPSK